MKVGVQLPEVEREVRWPEYAELARAAEEVGFDSIWVMDHFFQIRGVGRAEEPMLEGYAAFLKTQSTSSSRG